MGVVKDVVKDVVMDQGTTERRRSHCLGNNG